MATSIITNAGVADIAANNGFVGRYTIRVGTGRGNAVATRTNLQTPVEVSGSPHNIGLSSFAPVTSAGQAIGVRARGIDTQSPLGYSATEMGLFKGNTLIAYIVGDPGETLATKDRISPITLDWIIPIAPITNPTVNITYDITAAVPATDTVTGTVTLTQIRGLITAWWNALTTIPSNKIPNLAASKITSGMLNLLRIPNLPASKITSGVFNSLRIPSLDASKINSGKFANARIPTATSTLVGGVKVRTLTEAQYDALTSKDTETLYLFTS